MMRRDMKRTRMSFGCDASAVPLFEKQHAKVKMQNPSLFGKLQPHLFYFKWQKTNIDLFNFDTEFLL